MTDSQLTPDVFHDGERSVQERAGVRASAAKLGPRMIQSELAPDFAMFLTSASFLYLAAPTEAGQVWVSPLFGRSGFARPASPTRILIHARLAAEDPLAPTLADGATAAGILVLEPMNRARIRLNGTLRESDDGLVLELAEVFGNCPKYIQRRHPVALAQEIDPSVPRAQTTSALDASQQAMVRRADTFIIGSRHPQRGADASHRGGRPGFVSVSADGQTLTFPDYSGNTMFQTLGNLSVDPAAGLLFIDWDSGRTLQLTGRASIVWEPGRISEWEGAQRLVDVTLDRVVDRPSGLPVRWELVEPHRLNPPVPAGPA